jgi:hypothetical protein
LTIHLNQDQLPTQIPRNVQPSKNQGIHQTNFNTSDIKAHQFPLLDPSFAKLPTH